MPLFGDWVVSDVMCLVLQKIRCVATVSATYWGHKQGRVYNLYCYGGRPGVFRICGLVFKPFWQQRSKGYHVCRLYHGSLPDERLVLKDKTRVASLSKAVGLI